MTAQPIVLNPTMVALWIAAVCTVILVVVSVRRSGGVRDRSWVGWAGVVVGAGGAVGIWQLTYLGPWKPVLAGLLGGFALAMAVLDFPDSEEPSALAAPLGLVALFIAVRFKAVQVEPGLVLACLTGAAAAAGVLAAVQRATTAVAFVGVASVGWATYILGRSGTPGESAQNVVFVLTAALLALLLGEVLHTATRKSKLSWPPFATALAFGAVAYFVTSRTTDFPDLPLVVSGAALLAVAVSLATRKLSDPVFAVLVGSVVWLGAATIAFSYGRGYGMALAALVAVCASAICGDRRGLAMVSPMVALTLYRLARHVYPDTTRAFDIGQHYALVGLFLGLLVPLMVLAWGRKASSGSDLATSAATGLAGLATLLGTAFAVVFLGQKGASGLAVGFALSPAIAAVKGHPPKTGLAVGIGLACWTVAVIGARAMEEDLARPEKTRLLGMVAGVILVLVVAVWALTRFRKVETA